ncbi:MAG: acetyl-CoA decarbonylase/synthase complex subunit gamma [Deltaproteobacteria bacterium]|jgi:acetyl-CoA decarbonylase/synthase complex subunit gamma|nr:acetyl-CoA decarbonylase/synthase complex subunit gamma [Deltaproteobacteria bacterium]
MALTGIEIFKKLPKTNCGECGVPTCLAFAMKLAAGQAELSACPYVSEEAKAALEEASAPPIRPVVIGTGDKALKIGGETVMFRHEKRFVNPTGIAVLVTDKMNEAEVDKRLKKLNELKFERVGLILQADLVAVKGESGDPAQFETLVKKVKEKLDGKGMVLMSEDPKVLSAGAKACADRKPLLYAATKANADAMAGLAKEISAPLAVKGNSLDELAELTTKLTAAGLKDLVLDSGARTPKKLLEDQIIMRRAALMKKFRPLGFPTITFPCAMTTDPMKETLLASMLVAKYGGIVVLSDLEGHSLFPLLLERMNIYTDPQRPMATTEGIYEIGGPGENSPVLITSNFSLTYFIVSGEIEGSRIPSWLLVKDTEGLSVMTAWAAGKFGADVIAPFVKKCGIADKVKHRKLIIPGYAAVISGELEEELPDWQVLIGPREAGHIPAYIRMWKPE